MAVELIEAIVIKKGGEQKAAGVLAIDLKDHDPLFILADDGGIDLIVGGKAYLGGIELYGLAYHLRLTVEFYGRAMDDILFLVFIDDIAIIRVSDKIHVYIPFRHEGQGYPLLEMHSAVVDADPADRVVVLENQVVTINLADDLKIGPAAVFAFRLGIGDLLYLGFQQQRHGHRQCE